MSEDHGQSKPRSSVANGVAYTLIGLMLLVFLLSQCDSDTPRAPDNDASSSSSSAEACPLVPMEPIPIRTIAAAYEANEAAAQKQFGDRCILVEGIVTKITLDIGDEAVIYLAADDFDEPRVRLLEEAQEQAVNLSKGDKRLFLCNDISETLGTPVMDGCYVVLPKAAPPS